MSLAGRRAGCLAAALLLGLPGLYTLLLLGQAWRLAPGIAARARAHEARGFRGADLPPEWKSILLAVEDPAFHEHPGVDLFTPGAGQTTLTQALAKVHCFEAFRPGIHAKLKQTACALVLDRRLDKELQLTLFLNTASLGPGPDGWVWGFPAAALAYRGRPLEELDRGEFLTLVAMLIGPATYHPVRGPERLARRVARIEALLAGRCRPAGHGDVYYEACAGAAGG